jgi:hypothetical protein
VDADAATCQRQEDMLTGRQGQVGEAGIGSTLDIFIYAAGPPCFPFSCDAYKRKRASR